MKNYDFKYLKESFNRHMDGVIGRDFNPELSNDTEAFPTMKKAIPVQFKVANQDMMIQTLEGPVSAKKGDYIMTGVKGENWPIDAQKFKQTYDIIEPNVATKKPIKVYAKEMTRPFQVKVSWSDSLLSGGGGDFLVQYGHKDYGIVEKEVFSKTYEKKKDETRN